MTLGGIIATLIGGLVIGLLGRFFAPGRNQISMLATVIIGILGSLAGAFLWRAIGGSDTKGIDWIAFGIGVAVAAILVFWYARFTGKE